MKGDSRHADPSGQVPESCDMLLELSTKLRDIFRKYIRPEESDTARMAARLADKVLALVETMPALPDTAVRAVELANDPDCQMPQFARLIEGDAAIATAILRVANSAFYAGGMPAVKLQQAVVRLGVRPCQNLIVAIGMRTLFRQLSAGARARCETLWHHAYVVASICRQINRSFRLGFDGEEFSAGLLHDLGRILLLLADPSCFELARAMDFHEEDVLDRERQAIGIDHCALGAWFGEHSKLPAALIQVIRHHHEPVVSERSSDLVTLVATADDIANHLQLQSEPDAYDPAGNNGLACLWARWSDEKKARLLGELPVIMEESLRAAADERAG
jgi:HD-like signal output (HDOD) protein